MLLSRALIFQTSNLKFFYLPARKHPFSKWRETRIERLRNRSDIFKTTSKESMDKRCVKQHYHIFEMYSTTIRLICTTFSVKMFIRRPLVVHLATRVHYSHYCA